MQILAPALRQHLGATTANTTVVWKPAMLTGSPDLLVLGASGQATCLSLQQGDNLDLALRQTILNLVQLTGVADEHLRPAKKQHIPHPHIRR